MRTFEGYERQDGSVGVRNHLLVIAPIDCSFEPAKRIADQIDGAVAVTQHHGCEFNEMVASTLIGIGCNPNVAGVLLLGLGCESLTSEILAEGIRRTGKPVEILTIQQEGGTIASIAKGKSLLEAMAKITVGLERKLFPISKLTLAVECGGSDATSGLAANPATGVAVDLLIDEGGAAIISEPQEMTGTQQILSKRGVNEKVAHEIDEMIDREEERMKAMGIDSRFISKGNIDGGLTTIEEKSLGAIRKGGSRAIQGVLENSWRRLEKPNHSGLWLQDGTQWDVPSITHMLAAGAQVVAFTTGRGSTTGHAIAPVIKITGNSETFARMVDNMDMNAGTIMDGTEFLHAVGKRIFDTVIEVASGRQTKAEALGYKDFIVFTRDRAAEHLLGFC